MVVVITPSSGTRRRKARKRRVNMKLDSKIRYRCRECGNTSDSDHYPLRFCPECKRDGTVYVIGESVLAAADTKISEPAAARETQQNTNGDPRG